MGHMDAPVSAHLYDVCLVDAFRLVALRTRGRGAVLDGVGCEAYDGGYSRLAGSNVGL